MPMHNAQALIEKIQSLPVDRIAEVENFVDFLQKQPRQQRKGIAKKEPLDFPVDDLGSWPKGLSLRREDMYDNDER